PTACTTAICRAPAACHCVTRCPSTEVLPQGKSNLGLPIRDDAPAARIMTPQAFMEVTSFRGADEKTWGHNLALVKTNENNEPIFLTTARLYPRPLPVKPASSRARRSRSVTPNSPDQWAR